MKTKIFFGITFVFVLMLSVFVSAEEIHYELPYEIEASLEEGEEATFTVGVGENARSYHIEAIALTPTGTSQAEFAVDGIKYLKTKGDIITLPDSNIIEIIDIYEREPGRDFVAFWIKIFDQEINVEEIETEFINDNLVVGYCNLRNERTKICEFLGDQFTITRIDGCGPYNPVEITVSYFGGTETLKIVQEGEASLGNGLMTIKNMGSPCSLDFLNLRFEKVIEEIKEETETTPINGIADLSNYPKMFVKNGASNVHIVTGDYAHASNVIAAIEIAITLEGYFKLNDFENRMRAKLASEVSDYSNTNLIIVGNPCNNEIAAELMGNPSPCNKDFSRGEGIIKKL